MDHPSALSNLGAKRAVAVHAESRGWLGIAQYYERQKVRLFYIRLFAIYVTF
jgi:hypothetical protein